MFDSFIPYHASLAQLREQLICNQQVVGLNPIGSSIQIGSLICAREPKKSPKLLLRGLNPPIYAISAIQHKSNATAFEAAEKGAVPLIVAKHIFVVDIVVRKVHTAKKKINFKSEHLTCVIHSFHQQDDQQCFIPFDSIQYSYYCMNNKDKHQAQTANPIKHLTFNQTG